ncbi:MAG: YceI family protein [Pseudomonadota bacterium]
MRLASLVLAATVLVAAGAMDAARAADWIVDRAASRVVSLYTFNGKEREGGFEAFEGTGSFDAVEPETAELTLTIETSSIVLGNMLEEAFATSVEGFDSRNHPLARFELQDVEPLGGDRFRVRGVAEVKGKRRRLVSEGTLRVAADEARAVGRLRLDRLRFGVGVGPIASLLNLGRWVTVEYELVARPAGGGSTGSQ